MQQSLGVLQKNIYKLKQVVLMYYDIPKFKYLI